MFTDMLTEHNPKQILPEERQDPCEDDMERGFRLATQEIMGIFNLPRFQTNEGQAKSEMWEIDFWSKTIYCATHSLILGFFYLF